MSTPVVQYILSGASPQKPPQPLKLKTSANLAMHSRKRLNDQGGSRFLCIRKWFLPYPHPEIGNLGRELKNFGLKLSGGSTSRKMS